MVLVSFENDIEQLAAIADANVNMAISQEVGDIQFVSGVHLLHARTGEQQNAGNNEHACPTHADALFLSNSLHRPPSTGTQAVSPGVIGVQEMS